jgi:hypothetical protein
MRAWNTVRQHTVPLEHAVSLFRLKPEPQFALTEIHRHHDDRNEG